MHAMLALSAINLTVTSTSSLYSTALNYRGLAISGLNAALSTTPKCKADADAIVATCWILAAATVYLGESVEEFFTMMRGIGLVLRRGWGGKYGTSFVKLEGDGQEEVIMSRLKDVRLLPAHLVAEARESIEMMGGLEMKSVEEEVFKLYAELVRLLSVSSLEGWFP
jgi:Fungal specific transcription factor domain